MKNSIVTSYLVMILVMIIVVCISYILWNNFILPKTNSYIGINMKCKFCHKNKGSHSHNLDKSNFNNKYENIALSDKECPICKQNPGSYHAHYNETLLQ